MPDDKRPNLAELQADLESASEAFQDARQAEMFARNRATDALNRLNLAQKALDAGVKAMRDHAPVESDWKTEALRSRFCPRSEPAGANYTPPTSAASAPKPPKK